MEFRPYHEKALDYVKDGLKSNRQRMLMVMPTGSGKTVLLAEICRTYLNLRKAANILIITESQLVLESTIHYLGQALNEEINKISEKRIKEEDFDRFQISAATVSSVYPSPPSYPPGRDILIISLDINYSAKNNRPALSHLLRLADVSDSTFINLTSYATKGEISSHYQPEFRVDQGELIRYGALIPVTLNHATPRITSRDSESHLSIRLRLFSENFPPDGKAIVYCSNTRQAELAAKILESHSDHISPVLITGREIDTDQKFHEFRIGEKYNVAVNVKMLATGYADPQITDVVLLRKLINPQELGRAVASVQIASNEKLRATIWDYADNKQLDKFIAVSENNHFEADLPDLRESYLEPNFIDEPEPTPAPEPDPSSQNKIKQFLSNPIDDKPAKKDLLGRSKLVHILKGIIDRDAKKHLTLALFGKWGSGKSSVIEMLADRYRDDTQCTMVVFNAWQNEHSQNMTASIAERLVDELYGRKGIVDQVILSVKKKILLDKNALFLNLLFIAAITVAVVAFYITRDIELFSWSGLSTSVVYLISLSLPIIKSYLETPFTGKLRELAKRPDFGTHIGINHSIRNQLNALLKSYGSSWPRRKAADDAHKFVVVIDDLDRCSDEKIIQVLEAVQLVVDLENVVVIIAVDHEVLLRAVASRYLKQHPELGRNEAWKTARDYLGKILQATISLDKPSARQRREFIAGRLYPDSIKDGAIETEIPYNPKSPPDSKPSKGPDGFQFSLAALADIDEEEEAYEESSEYLHSDAFEIDIFSKCAGTFDIHNARTMIRIHNAITLIKGLHPELIEDGTQLKLYIFLIFWYEVVSGTSEQDRSHYEAVLTGTQPDSPYWAKLGELAQELGAPQEDPRLLQKALSRIINISLPNMDAARTEKPLPQPEQAKA